MKTTPAFAILLTLVSLPPGPGALATQQEGPLFSFAGGLAFSGEDHVENPGWVVNVSLERVVGRVVEVRGMLAAAQLRAESQGQESDASYQYLKVDVLGADLFSGTAGLGLYRSDLDKPLVAEPEQFYRLGLNAGVRFLIPIRHDSAFTVDTTIHRILEDGPNTFLTVGFGLCCF